MKGIKILRPCLLLGFTLCACTAFAQTLFTYGNQSVSVDEFMHAYRKSPDTTVPVRKSLTDYYTLYTRYVLKVQDAYDNKIDELPAQQQEYAQYRDAQVQRLIDDKANVSGFYQQLFTQSLSELQLEYCYFSKTDAHARQTADSAWKALRSGNSFAAMVNKFCKDDELRKSEGKIGWVSLFVLPYDIAQAAWLLRNGESSEIINGETSYHIIRRVASRPARGLRYAAHILFAELADQSDEEKARTKKLADSVHNLIKTGKADFAGMTSLYSNDRSTATRGGTLPAMQTGMYEPAFEQSVFGSDKPGLLPAPVKTSFGWHILRLDSALVPNVKNESAWQQHVQATAAANGWLDMRRKNVRAELKQQTGFKSQFTNYDSLWTYSRARIMNDTAALLAINAVHDSTILFSANQKQITVTDWLYFLRKTGFMASGNNAYWQERYRAFEDEQILLYYRDHIETVDTAMARRLREFKEANMLFEMMDRKVWWPSQTDSAAMAAYYQEHKQEFVWDDNALLLYVTGTNDVAIRAMRQTLQQRPSDWRKVTDQFEANLFADSARMEIKDLTKPLQASAKNFKPGYLSPVVNNNADGAKSFIYIFKPMPKGETKTIEECRMQLVTAWQQKLEDDWIAELTRKYPVVRHEAAWQQLLDAASAR